MMARQPVATQSRHLLFLLVTACINFIGVGIIGPLAPSLAERYGADPLTIGLLAMSYSLAQFVGVPALGALSDRYGRRPVLLLSLVGSAIGYVIFGIGGALWVLFLGRVMEGLTNGNISAVFASAADLSKPEDRTRTFGAISAAIGIGLIVGPLLGGVLSTISAEAPIYLVALLSFANAIWCYVALPESLAPERRAPELKLAQLNPITRIGYVIQIYQLRRMLVASILMAFSMAILLSNLPVLMSDVLGWAPNQVAVLYALYGGMIVLMQALAIPRLLHRFDEQRLATVGFLISACGYILTALTAIWAIPWLIYPSPVVIAIGNALINTPLTGMISKTAGPDRQGRVQGGNLALQTLANVVGPVVGGGLYQTISFSSPYWLGVSLLIAGALVAFTIPNQIHPPNKPVAAVPVS
jgi:MFS transporter, DHA1 family, tetracycline resistance protein